MKEEMLEAIYGTVERLEQKVDELSASTKKTETGAIPVPVNVDTKKKKKATLLSRLEIIGPEKARI